MRVFIKPYTNLQSGSESQQFITKSLNQAQLQKEMKQKRTNQNQNAAVEQNKPKLAGEKSKKNDLSQQGEVFLNRKNNKTSKSQQQTHLSNNQILTSENTAIDAQALAEQSKKLKKKISKAPKAPQKIKVRNKFFADIQIQENNLPEQIVDDKNLIQEEISNKSINKQNSDQKYQLTFDKKKTATETDNQSKFECIVQKTEHLRARHEFKNSEQDRKFKSYVKKKLQEVQYVEQVVIDSLSIPQVHKNKAISSALYLNSQSFKEAQQFSISLEEIPKKMTAQQRYKQKKMMKGRNYFYQKLNQQIKQSKCIKNSEIAAQIKQNQKTVKNKENAQKHLRNQQENDNSQSVSRELQSISQADFKNILSQNQKANEQSRLYQK